MYKKVKISILIFFAVIISCTIYGKVEAKNSYFNKFNNSPRINFTTNIKQYEDITVTIQDNNGIQNVNFYEIDETTNEKKEVPFKEEQINTAKKRKWKYTLSHNDYLKGEEKQFYVEATDTTGNTITKTFRVSNKNNCYKINNAPRINEWKSGKNKLSFVVKDNGQIKNIKLYDLNEESEEGKNKAKIQIGENKIASKNKIRITVDLSKFKTTEDKKYDIKIATEDNGENSQNAVIRIKFIINEKRIEEEKTRKKNVQLIDEEDVTIQLDKTVLMLDKHHYNFSDLKVVASPIDAEVTFSTNNPDVVQVNSRTGQIVAKGYGTAKITATATNGRKKATAKCDIRVMSTSTDPTEDSGKYVNYRNEKGSSRTYYLRYYSSSTDMPVTQWSQERIDKVHWTKEEVESYINNAAYLLKTYPDKFREGAEQTFYIHGSSNTQTPPADTKTYIKPKGELVVKGGKYILLFTTKNQCLYLLKLNDDGVWELDERIVCSAGYTWGAQFSKYLSFGYMTPRNGGIYSIHPKNAGDSSRNDSNSIHTGYTYGRPASLGCIRVGSSSTNMWKKIVYLFRDKHEPIKLIYY